MSPSPDTPSERDLELLSAYLDGELDERARTQLEQRLAQDRALRAELQRLRETVALVRSLPPVKAPRDFTLDPARYGRPVPWWSRLFDLGTVLQLSGALGTMAALAIIALAFLLSDQGAEPVSDQAPAVASPVALQASPLPSATAQPPTATLPPTPFPTPVIETFEEAESAAEAPAPEGDLAGGMAQSSPGPAEPLVAPEAVMNGEEGAAAVVPPALPLGTPAALESQAFAADAAQATAGDTTAQREAPDEEQEAAPAQAAPAISGTASLAPTQTQVAAVAPGAVELEQPAAADDGITADESDQLGEAEETAPAGQAAADDDSGAERVSGAGKDDDRDVGWLAGIGAGLLVASLALLLIGRRKARVR